MKLAVSYFYQIRNFKKNMIPVSTAMWDPKWFHENQGPDHIFFDNRGIINGIRILPFVPGPKCNNLCRGIENCETKDPKTCPFLKAYREQLEELDIKKFIDDTIELVEKYKETTEFDGEPTVVFIVYEAPNNPCSERWVLLDFFKDKGIECQELSYPIDDLDWSNTAPFDF